MMFIGKDGILTRYLVAFCVITTGLCLVEGLSGSVLFPHMTMGFSGYLVPPAFGFLTSLTGLVMESEKELSVRQMVFRLLLQLALIEAIVFGINLWIGNRYSAPLAVLMALEIAAVFVFVYFVMWLNERRIAKKFNRMLAEWQKCAASDASEH